MPVVISKCIDFAQKLIPEKVGDAFSTVSLPCMHLAKKIKKAAHGRYLAAPRRKNSMRHAMLWRPARQHWNPKLCLQFGQAQAVRPETDAGAA